VNCGSAPLVTSYRRKQPTTLPSRQCTLRAECAHPSVFASLASGRQGVGMRVTTTSPSPRCTWAVESIGSR